MGADEVTCKLGVLAVLILIPCRTVTCSGGTTTTTTLIHGSVPSLNLIATYRESCILLSKCLDVFEPGECAEPGFNAIGLCRPGCPIYHSSRYRNSLRLTKFRFPSLLQRTHDGQPIADSPT